MFDDVVMSNNSSLKKRIYKWSRELRVASRKEKKFPGALKSQLKSVERILSSMKFTFPGQDTCVKEVIHDVVNRFALHWGVEQERQNNMATRARDILLRWGSFSEAYVDKAELLCDLKDCHNSGKKSCILLGFLVGAVAPSISVLPFVVPLLNDEDDPSRDGLIVSSIWFGLVSSGTGTFLAYALIRAFVKEFQIGIHLVVDFCPSPRSPL